jgi:hypothetical protein
MKNEALDEYVRLCDLQGKRERALREYVLDPTIENKAIVDQLGDIINSMMEKALKGLCGEKN